MNVDDQKNEISKLTGFHESKIFILNQVHGDGVVDLRISKNLSFPEGDAWIGEESNQVLCIKTADCMPLFFGPSKVLSL
ncbi:multi-copper polyphenol oxidoreductase laccase domain protein [Leptospira kirschneri str. 200801925]|nr:multi-copper polyphenol oxidoreductase laccase domain protein [Leptospira kirschneri str. 200801925]